MTLASQHCPRRRRRRHRLQRRRLAFTLSEILFAIGILAIFGLAATRLFQSTIRIGQTTAEQQDAAASFESALSVLRADVWVAGELSAPDPGTARAGKITWTVDETMLLRDAGERTQPRSWAVPSGVTFAAEGSTLILRVPPPKNARRGSRDVHMVSQPLLLSRLSP